jgi:hypothetical protein
LHFGANRGPVIRKDGVARISGNIAQTVAEILSVGGGKRPLRAMAFAVTLTSATSENSRCSCSYWCQQAVACSTMSVEKRSKTSGEDANGVSDR